MLTTATLTEFLTFPGAQAQEKTTGTAPILPGTILPGRLNSSLSSSKTQPGHELALPRDQDNGPNGFGSAAGASDLIS